MFNKKNLLYFSTNKDLGKPEPESEEDFLGELHTATTVIAQVQDDEGAEEIVKRVNMHDDLIQLLKHFQEIMKANGNINKSSQPFPLGSKKYLTTINELLKQA